MASSSFRITGDSTTQRTDFFARQKLITWWNQSTISSAKVLVVGAGALGNETIKNLMLLGFGNLLICDFDLVEDSNLSRTVLFRREQSGKPKAEAAAERARELALVDDPHIAWIHGDITTTLGLGMFEQIDIVLCCLDNIEARMFINRCCLRTGTPWLDSGINELSGHVMGFASKDGACYECGLSMHQYAKGRERYACGEVKRRFYQAGHVPTVQVTSSIVAGLLTQECLKLLCNTGASLGKRISYQGACNDLEVNNLRRRDSCDAHVSLPPMLDLAISSSMVLRDVLTAVEARAGAPIMLDLNDRLYRGFVARYECSLCDKSIAYYGPVHNLFDVDLFCDAHSPKEISNCRSLREPREILSSFTLRDIEPRILTMSLAQLGVPQAHILSFRRPDGAEFAVRTDADIKPMSFNAKAREAVRADPPHP